jgi:hypothetical protein
MWRWVACVVLLALLTGCREVRVKTEAHGTTAMPGGNQIIVVRHPAELEALGIKAPVKFNHEFGVVLIMGPHKNTGWRQVIESIRANDERVRIVAFEAPPPDGGEPTKDYRTYTLWIVPLTVFRVGSILDVVTPSGDPIATTVLK